MAKNEITPPKGWNSMLYPFIIQCKVCGKRSGMAKGDTDLSHIFCNHCKGKGTFIYMNTKPLWVEPVKKKEDKKESGSEKIQQKNKGSKPDPKSAGDIKSLIKKLESEKDPDIKRNIRRQLRRLGHKGGLKGGK